MTTMTTDETINWRKLQKGAQREPVLIGRRISNDWLLGTVSLLDIRIKGNTRAALSGLREAAKRARLYLPITALRTALIVALEDVGGVVSVDRDLGLEPLRSGESVAAVKLTPYGQHDEASQLERIQGTFSGCVLRWFRDDVIAWAESNGLGDDAIQACDAVKPSDVEIARIEERYVDDRGRPNFALVAQIMGRRLAGEELFDGMGPCEVVALSEAHTNVVELMARPTSAGRDSFSMVARLRVSSLPYSKDVFLSVSAAKRVWARKEPKAYSNMPRRVLGYVMTVDRPVTPVTIKRLEDKWEFGDDYAALYRASNQALPATLAEAIAQREFNDTTQWWVGLPELPRLFKSLSPRTVFEGDEVDLMTAVCKILDPIVVDKPIAVREYKRVASLSKVLQEMLKVSDIGLAGAALRDVDEDSEEGDDEIEDEGADQTAADRARRIDQYRQQNTHALLQCRGDAKPIVWLLGGTTEETDLVRRTVDKLFGESVELITEPMPSGVHGLRAKLDGSELKARARFEKRVGAWQSSAKTIQKESNGRPTIVLICTPDRFDKKPEDSVNYFAGIHAMSCIDANVHYVLPIDGEDEIADRQNFVYRLQSALLDVLLAHTGLVLGVPEFVSDILPNNAPQAIYGIQAVRSRARSRSGEGSVSFVLFSRLVVATGITEIRIIYRDKATKVSAWMPLSQGLSQIGKLRTLQESDEPWLRASFTNVVRDQLVEISESDPNAVVMIDWSTVANLWPGIRDEDLQYDREPVIGNSSLSRLGGMTFIRLRRGDNVISLRAAKSSIFRAWRRSQTGPDEETGEQHLETYYTTERNIVELQTAESGPARKRHFIGSMSYPKTVQILRGYSCYRPVTRMKPVGGGYFTPDRKTPPRKDASLPSALDITILSCPENVAPETYATLVMGLRLGFAHYDDWTSLPAPLFFRRKVDDYIIRYGSEQEGEADTPPDRDETPPPAGPRASHDLVEQIVGNGVDALTESAASDIDVEEDALPSDEKFLAFSLNAIDLAINGKTPSKDLVDLALCKDPFFIWDAARHIGFNLTTYHRLIATAMAGREAPRVRVALPSWVDTATTLTPTLPMNKKRGRRCWEAIVDWNFVGPGIKKPSDDRIIEFAARSLVVPQSLTSIGQMLLPLGPVTFRRVEQIIREECPRDLVDEEMAKSFLLDPAKLSELFKWAISTSHDEFLGWLILLVAHWPLAGWVEVLHENLVRAPGPRTQDALMYYIVARDVMHAFYLHEGPQNQIEGLRIAPPYTEMNVLKSSVRSEDHDDSAGEPPMQASAGEPVSPASDQRSILDLVQSLVPGHVDFAENYTRICEGLAALNTKHLAILEDEKAQQSSIARQQALIARQTALNEALIEERDEIMVDVISVVPPPGELDDVELEFDIIEEALTNLRQARATVTGTGAQTATTMAERKAITARKAEAEQHLIESVEKLHSLLEVANCFQIRTEAIGQVAAPEQMGNADSPADPPTEIIKDAKESKAPDTTEPGLGAESAAQNEQPMESSQKCESETGNDENTAPEIQNLPKAAPHPPHPMPLTSQASSVSRPHVSPATAAPLPLQRIEPVLEEVPDLESVQNFDAYVLPLRRLIDQRLYGLAAVHVAALGHVAEESADDSLIHQHAILKSLVAALDGMDCQFSFDTKLSSELDDLLAAQRLPVSSFCDPKSTALGILAAGIGNMLFDESEVQWRIGHAVSAPLQEHKALSALLDHIDNIRQRGHVISRDAFVSSRVGDKAALESELARLQRRASEWRSSPETHPRFNHKGYEALYDWIFSPKHPVGACISAIAKGETSKIRGLFDNAHNKFKKPGTTIDEAWRKLLERGRSEGPYRNLIVGNIEAAAKFTEDYLALIERSGAHQSDLPHDSSEFLSRLAGLLRGAIAEVKEITPASETASLYCEACLKALGCVLRLFDATEGMQCISTNKQMLLIELPLGRDLMPTMGTKDGKIPSLSSAAEVLAETTRCSEIQLTLEPTGEGEDIDSVLSDAYDRHLTAKRFLPAFLIERQLGFAQALTAALTKKYNSERESLRAELQDARQRVAHAMTLSALPVEAEANKMQRTIEELLELVRQDKGIGHPDGESYAYPDFPHARAALLLFVLRPLEARLEAAKQKLITELEEQSERDDVSPIDVERVRKMLDSGNAAGLRTAHDALGILKRSGRLPTYADNTAFDATAEYEAFMRSVHGTTAHKPRINTVLEMLRSEPSAEDPTWLAALDPEQRLAAIRLLEIWVGFFEKKTVNNQDALEELFREMGIPKTPMPIPESGRPQRGRLSFGEGAFVFPTNAEEPLFIPPSLGSMATHVEGYVLWGTPQENDVRLALQENTSTPTMVLVRLKLSMAKRAALTRDLPALIVDDELITYVALHPNERFQSLMRVAMLTFWTNPYDDYDAQPVPPEMFFGRQGELTKLREVKSLAVLYGGRRLGKSSLLSQIAQEENQRPDRRAVLISMQTVDVMGDHVLSAWEFISDALIRHKIIPAMGVHPKDWRQVQKHVEQNLIKAAAVKHLYLLIDEADVLMGRELKARPGETKFVRTLDQFMNDIEHVCHVRAVIAGLHNVTRMTNEENTVFGKADAIALNPFSTSEDIGRGIRLITKPLAAMGYLFDVRKQDLPLHILSVCNFYPAFVQLYCKKLIERLQNNRQQSVPPLTVTSKDLDAVEADTALLADLRKKFEYNLDVDKRYKVIALALADEYYSQIDGGEYEGLSVSDIRDYCEVYGGQRFENATSGVYESLLDEMIKLNMLERIGTRYVLRNPQIAMMIGDRERITSLLHDISKNESSEIVRNHGERRSTMKHGHHIKREFPMPTAWIRRYMDPADGQLIILAGNVLSGIQDLIQMERDPLTLRDNYAVIPVPGNGVEAVVNEMDRLRRKPVGALGNMLFVRPAGWKIQQIKEYVSVAKKGRARVVLLANAERAFDLMQQMEMDGEERLGYGDGWRVDGVPAWSQDAVYLRVSEHSENLAVADSLEALEALRTASCGFGQELVKLCVSSLRVDQAIAAPRTVRQRFAPSTTVFYQNIGLPQSFLNTYQKKMEEFLYLLDGLEKHNGSTEEALAACEVSRPLFDYLQWMALIQDGPKGTWMVPELYLDLLRQKAS